MAHKPEAEEGEIKDILAKKGYWGADLDQMTALVIKNKKFWVDLMMGEELGLAPVGKARPLKGAVTTFLAFIAAGFAPIVPFFFIYADSRAFWVSTAVAGAMFFIVGASRAIFTNRAWYWSGLEMFLMGSLAALISYGVGFLIRALIG